MKIISRRNLLIGGAAAVAASGVAWELSQRPTKPNIQIQPKLTTAQKYITCFYQFNERAIKTLAPALPDGPEFMHVFVQSKEDTEPRPKWVRMIHHWGPSFKYAYCLDLDKYKGWENESDDQLKSWAIEFRGAALDPSARADYFGFNEMPREAPQHPELRQKIARWLGYLHSAGGGPQFRGVFYLSQQNLNPASWLGSGDEFWQALDDTCDLVVGEHFERNSFTTDHTTQQIADVFDGAPRWMTATGDPRLERIGRDKFTMASSCYYGPRRSGWAGLQDQESTLDAMKQYLEKLIQATRLSEFGKRRIAFSPLDAILLDESVYPILADVLKADYCGKHDS